MRRWSMRFSGRPRDDGLPGRVQGWRKRLGVEPSPRVGGGGPMRRWSMRFSGRPRDDGLPGRVQGWRKRLGVEPSPPALAGGDRF